MEYSKTITKHLFKTGKKGIFDIYLLNGSSINYTVIPGNNGYDFINVTVEGEKDNIRGIYTSKIKKYLKNQELIVCYRNPKRGRQLCVVPSIWDQAILEHTLYKKMKRAV